MKVSILVFFLFVSCFSCPQACNCVTKTPACTVCLGQFYQFYNSSSLKCECYEQFAPYIGFENQCCPVICNKCYIKGCASCNKGAVVEWNDTLKYFDCVCMANYFKSGSKCLCRSLTNPSEYYYNPFNNQCYKCPLGCTCTQQGCVSCEQSANRTIVEIDPDKIACFCKGQLMDIEGRCACLDQCTCQGNVIKNCSKQSKRFFNYTAWHCQYPYTSVNNSCKCLQPYQQHLVFGQIRCICKSKLNITGYYEINNVCHKCLDTCVCDFRGGIVCYGPLNEIYHLRASCLYYSTKVNNQCYCLSPYYYSNETGQCNCLNQKDPIQYWRMSQYSACQACPQQCICTQQGCIQCQNNTLRLIKRLDGYQKMYCDCIPNTNYMNNRCVCQSPFYYDFKTKTCNCLNVVSPNLAYVEYYESSTSFCRLCPQYCLCNEQGCYFCSEQAGRKVTLQLGQYRCDCSAGLFADMDTKVCICPYQNQFQNSSTGQCQCKENYETISRYFDNQDAYQIECKCKSLKYPNEYYQNLFTSECLACPDGCRCDFYGCHDCDPLSMRYTSIHKMGAYATEICSCVSNAFQVNNVCTICQIGSYYNGEGCSACLECQSCNHFGCLSCNDRMALDNYTCICLNQNLTNIDGNCVCQKGQYLNTFISTNQAAICSDCPVNCQTCAIVNTVIQCTSCDLNQTHRENIFQSNCPCQEGYSEAPVRSRYCCPNNCKDCNATHCLSCPLYTFRSLVQGECLCLSPYTQRGDVVCGCSYHSYYLNQSCLQCPSKCKTCIYDQKQAKPVCEMCQDGKNRNISLKDCFCLKGFMQTNPQSIHCYAQHCVNQQANCSKCLSRRVLSYEGLCICQVGYYQSNEVCQKCPIAGCLQCRSKSVCNRCDQANNFYLADSVCLEVSTSGFIISQIEQQGVVIEIQSTSQIIITPSNSSNLQDKSIIAVLYKLQSLNSSMVVSFFVLDILYFSQTSSTMTVIVDHPPSNLQSSIISLSFNSKSQYLRKPINVKTGRLLSQDTYQRIKYPMYQNVLGIALVFILMNIALYLNGYKHNQMMFYMQTLCFLGYYLSNKSIQLILLLQNFKVFSFNFASGPLYRIIPDLYYESSAGNFQWLTGDSNIFRVIGLPLLILLILIPLYLIIKYLYLFGIVKRIKNVIIFKYKRWFYRLFQFFFKSLMYSIIFFSINTFFNFNCSVYFSHAFKTICFGICITLICFFFTFVVYLLLYNQMNKLHSVEIILEFIIDCLTSLVLIITASSPTLCLTLMATMIFIKDFSFFLAVKTLSKQKNWVNSIRLVVVPLKIVPLVTIYFDSYSYTIWSVLTVILVINLMQLFIIVRKNIVAHYDKLKMVVEESRDYSIQMFL